MDLRDDLAEIDASGTLHPIGGRAIQRLRAREGAFHVLPAPSHLVLMRRALHPERPPADSRPCVLAGEIRTAGALCDIAAFAGHSAWRGELVVLDATESRSVYFDEGQVVGAQSTAERERLGQVLYRYGVLSTAQVSECAASSDGGRVRFGEAAVKAGYVTRERLFGLMARQIEEIFYGMLLVSTGTFYFLDGFDDGLLWSRQSLSVGTLMREGVRRMHETRYFRARIPSEGHVPARAAERAPPESDPLGVFAWIDGQRSVAELCRVLGHGEFEVTRALFQLVQSGHVVVRPPRLSASASTAVYNQAIALLLRELDAMDEGDEVRAQIASFSARDPLLSSLLASAGPADDGTLDANEVQANVAKLPDAQGAEDHLAQKLYECASYALFLARPHLRRAEDARRAATGEDRPRLSQRVAALLSPIAPETGSSPKGGTPA